LAELDEFTVQKSQFRQNTKYSLKCYALFCLCYTLIVQYIFLIIYTLGYLILAGYANHLCLTSACSCNPGTAAILVFELKISHFMAILISSLLLKHSVIAKVSCIWVLFFLNKRIASLCPSG